LAGALKGLGRRSEAEPIFRRALAIDEAVYGDTHPNVARDLNNIGGLLLDDNRPAEAEPLMRRSASIHLRFFAVNGRPHPHCMNAVHGFEVVLRALGRSDVDILAEINALAAAAGVAEMRFELPRA
jgi:hypothetical protein